MYIERGIPMNIQNQEIYLSRMEAGMEDKLHFIKHLNPNVNTIVDFGCANAALGMALSNVAPELQYVGYDNSYPMLKEAKKNLPNGRFYSTLISLTQDIDTSTSMLVLSSVIHEVYSYLEPLEIFHFWDFVLNSGFKQIAIRDMGLETILIASSEPVGKLPVFMSGYIHGKYGIKTNYAYFEQYYQMWLKYWYQENWDREYHEDYFAMTVEEIEATVHTNRNYKIAAKELFVIPWVVEKIKADFGFNPLTTTTHYKMILNLDE